MYNKVCSYISNFIGLGLSFILVKSLLVLVIFPRSNFFISLIQEFSFFIPSPLISSLSLFLSLLGVWLALIFPGPWYAILVIYTWSDFFMCTWKSKVLEGLLSRDPCVLVRVISFSFNSRNFIAFSTHSRTCSLSSSVIFNLPEFLHVL